MYTLQGKTRQTHHTLPTQRSLSHVVNTKEPFAKSSTDLYRSTAPEKKGSQHNPQLDGRLIRGFIPSFSPTTGNEVVGKRRASVDNQLLG
jgi:hypothetical protein